MYVVTSPVCMKRELNITVVATGSKYFFHVLFFFFESKGRQPVKFAKFLKKRHLYIHYFLVGWIVNQTAFHFFIFCQFCFVADHKTKHFSIYYKENLYQYQQYYFRHADKSGCNSCAYSCKTAAHNNYVPMFLEFLFIILAILVNFKFMVYWLQTLKFT